MFVFALLFAQSPRRTFTSINIQIQMKIQLQIQIQIQIVSPVDARLDGSEPA